MSDFAIAAILVIIALVVWCVMAWLAHDTPIEREGFDPARTCGGRAGKSWGNGIDVTYLEEQDPNKVERRPQ